MSANGVTREAWLGHATEAVRGMFAEHGAKLPDKLRLSCGFPSVGALSRSRKRIGECWHAGAVADGTVEVFVSPVLDDAMDVLGVLIHELCHACVGSGVGHRGPFATLARAMGLAGKMTSTTVGKDLAAKLQGEILPKLGEYPHGAIHSGETSDRPKKQGTRMVKCECAACGYIVRTTRKWLEIAIPRCPVDESEMSVEGGGAEGEPPEDEP